MKNFSILALLTFAATAPVAQAAQSQVRPANLYTCSSADLQVSFSTTSFAGNPSLSISGDDWGGQLSLPTVQKSPAGLEISAQVEGIADAAVDYKLVLPVVNLGQGHELVQIKGLLITTTSGGLIAGPQPGPVQSNEFVQLDCQAQSVLFAF